MDTRLEYLQELEKTIPAIVLGGDPAFSYRTRVPGTLVQESFCEVWSEYNAAIVNGIIGLRRHLVVLMAWNQVLNRFDEDDEERIGIMIDFVEPTLFRARDLPAAIRSQCHQCVGKMLYILKSRDETLDEVRNPDHNDTYWRAYRDEHYIPCAEYDAYIGALSHLRNDDSADYLRQSHGQRHHDISTIVGTKRHVPMVWELEGGGLGFGYKVDEINLRKEIAIIDEQRNRVQEAYRALDAYLLRLYDALMDDSISRGYDIRRS